MYCWLHKQNKFVHGFIEYYISINLSVNLIALYWIIWKRGNTNKMHPTKNANQIFSSV